MLARRASSGDGVRLVEVGQNPIQVRRKPFRAPNGDRLVDVLALTPVALGRDHHPACDLVGDLAAQFATDEMQAGVDARRGARAGDQVAVVDEQHVAVDPGGREPASQLVGVHPVRRAGSPVQQPRLARHERARADGEDDRAGVGGGPNRLQRLGQVVGAADRRDRDEVCSDQVVEPVIRGERRADRRPQRLAGLWPADLEIEVGHTVGGAIDSEDLADHAELENGQAVQHQRRYLLNCHGSILSHGVASATVGGIFTGE